jgi:hypothetical protein
VPLVVRAHQEIIDLTDVALDSHPVLEEVIQGVEVDVGKELAALVADGDVSPPLTGREQVVAGKVVQIKDEWAGYVWVSSTGCCTGGTRCGESVSVGDNLLL